MPVELQGRHGRNAPPPPVGFRCPACGEQNAGAIEEGCAHCGSGKAAAQHVGVTPPVTAVEQTSPAAGLDRAFAAWIKTLPEDKWNATRAAFLTEIVKDAFMAGYDTALATIQQRAAEPALSGTAESRTVIAALRLFLDQVVPTAKEEIESGEFLGATEIRALIRKIERQQEQ